MGLGKKQVSFVFILILLVVSIGFVSAQGQSACTDVDGDGYIKESSTQNCDLSKLKAKWPSGSSWSYKGTGDCMDNKGNVNPGVSEKCSVPVDFDCDGFSMGNDPDCGGSGGQGPSKCPDKDNDGYDVCPPNSNRPSDNKKVDCLDDPKLTSDAPAINPGSKEICGDGIDNDCDNKGKGRSWFTNVDEGCVNKKNLNNSCQWNSWRNTDHPTGKGDFETVENIKSSAKKNFGNAGCSAKGKSVCGLDCKAVVYHNETLNKKIANSKKDYGAPAYPKAGGKLVDCIKTGENLSVSTTGQNKGVVCRASDQPDGECDFNYQVRFKCCDGQCPSNKQRSCDWTGPFDVDKQSGAGDYESMNALKQKGLDSKICDNPETVKCEAFVEGDWVDAYETGEKITCSPDRGVICKDKNQPDGSCDYNYRVSFGCGPNCQCPYNESLDLNYSEKETYDLGQATQQVPPKYFKILPGTKNKAVLDLVTKDMEVEEGRNYTYRGVSFKVVEVSRNINSTNGGSSANHVVKLKYFGSSDSCTADGEHVIEYHKGPSDTSNLKNFYLQGDRLGFFNPSSTGRSSTFYWKVLFTKSLSCLDTCKYGCKEGECVNKSDSVNRSTDSLEDQGQGTNSGIRGVFGDLFGGNDDRESNVGSETVEEQDSGFGFENLLNGNFVKELFN